MSYNVAHDIVQRAILHYSIVQDETISDGVGRYIFLTFEFDSHVDGGAFDGFVLPRTINDYKGTDIVKISEIQRCFIVISVIGFAKPRVHVV